MSDDDTHFEMWYSGEGVSITQYDTSEPDDPLVEEEWWFTWTEVFAELTGIEGWGPEIHSEP